MEITFTPSAVGAQEAFLNIVSNDAYPPGDNIFIPLSGWGVDASVDPGELMATVIAFFDESVSGGSIAGSGPGNSAAGRLKAFGNMLKASSDLIEAGAYDLACTQLQDALNRTDGGTPPPDFVTGDSADELAAMIMEVMDALGCL
ncbi:MAG: hypothetical protein HY695_36025 [Deltaproteobacteria bacterium]|nr:hypothetical protein [Deltaproteobacteria bacterium]